VEATLVEKNLLTNRNKSNNFGRWDREDHKEYDNENWWFGVSLSWIFNKPQFASFKTTIK